MRKVQLSICDAADWPRRPTHDEFTVDNVLDRNVVVAGDQVVQPLEGQYTHLPLWNMNRR